MYSNLGTFEIPDLFTIHAPGIGRVVNVIGTKADVERRIRDRKANGEAFKGERLQAVVLALNYDGTMVTSSDIHAGPVCRKCDTLIDPPPPTVKR